MTGAGRHHANVAASPACIKKVYVILAGTIDRPQRSLWKNPAVAIAETNVRLNAVLPQHGNGY